MLVGEEVEKRVEIGMAKDGSGVGGVCELYPPPPFSKLFTPTAALCALQAIKQGL